MRNPFRQGWGLMPDARHKTDEEPEAPTPTSPREGEDTTSPPSDRPSPKTRHTVTSHLRTDFAHEMFPELPQKEACMEVKNVIRESIPLRLALQATGYSLERTQRGYTTEQLQILYLYFRQLREDTDRLLAAAHVKDRAAR